MNDVLASAPEGGSSQTVAVLGASSNPERYSNRAVRMLLEHGHRVIPVHPAQQEIEGLAVVPGLEMIEERVETVTVYVNPERVEELLESMLAIQPGRVIFNPGSESEEVATVLEEAGIEVLKACTLVLLSTGQF